jgi:hypothetical protein
VETSLVLVIFLALLLGVFDCGQVIFAHEALVERVRTAVRWGSLHKWDGAEPIVNQVLYGQPREPLTATQGYLGMKPENVRVTYHAPGPDTPDDEFFTVSIVNYESHFFSPWLARVLISPRPVLMTAPVEPVLAN